MEVRMHHHIDALRQLSEVLVVAPTGGDLKRALSRNRHFCGDIALDVASLFRRRFWRARCRLEYAVRRVELRLTRATGRRLRHFDVGLRKGTVLQTRLLLGEENHVPAADAARLAGRLLHPSTPAPEWPLVLAARRPTARRTHEELDRIASAHLNATGEYFGCRTLGEVHTFVASL